MAFSQDCRTIRPLNQEVLLIRQVLAGRRDLFEQLLQPHMRLLSHFVRTRIRNDMHADDIIQDTLMKALTRLAQFRSEASFRTWLIQIAINEIRQLHRKQMHSRASISIHDAFPEERLISTASSPIEDYERQETLRGIDSALCKLPEIYQNVVRLRDLQELSIAETAGLLQLSIPAVKTRHRRGRLLLSQFLRGSIGGLSKQVIDDSAAGKQLRPEFCSSLERHEERRFESV
jgi:RNA polymerase sigma-70 factor (ECF subfamily)